ncbi:hypothetical protein CONPUDRAFT_160548 [Coniophora puteana RWD-64-598 SS2]|uniref:Uncharacterized protein n=1 Tax=Coniophora puteana (strain RWD-64-598) TaxID=741705 RepID=R7SDJ3_CONPW|nr:uncharacterized protein CONPUDRAFT_160548 [Coniophora puteana RWD-64-598 SS2]EIW73950.1 hypothetical protein CONPUDRAFT_160548 [Coniophora puteana RWD-64-598 SS2]
MSMSDTSRHRRITRNPHFPAVQPSSRPPRIPSVRPFSSDPRNRVKREGDYDSSQEEDSSLCQEQQGYITHCSFLGGCKSAPPHADLRPQRSHSHAGPSASEATSSSQSLALALDKALLCADPALQSSTPSVSSKGKQCAVEPDDDLSHPFPASTAPPALQSISSSVNLKKTCRGLCNLEQPCASDGKVTIGPRRQAGKTSLFLLQVGLRQSGDYTDKCLQVKKAALVSVV